MSDPVRFIERLQVLEKAVLMPGGGDGPPGDVDHRVGRLERDVGDIKATLGRMEPLLIRIDERIKDMPTANQFGELKGRVSQLPTVWQLCALILSIFGLAFVLLRYGLPGH
jgi:hypothetical protein